MKNPTGWCQCGCGRKIPLSKWSRRGYKRGEPLLYIKGHQGRHRGPDFFVNHRTGCWIWQKSVGSLGYGRIWNGTGHDLAHRVYYERHIGPIPKGTELHHWCGEPLCVNPHHLAALTRRQHMAVEGRRAYGRYPVAG